MEIGVDVRDGSDSQEIVKTAEVGAAVGFQIGVDDPILVEVFGRTGEQKCNQ